MFEVRPIDLSRTGMAVTCELLHVVYPHAKHLTVDYLDRLYNGNPVGPTSGYSAFDEGTLIGHYLMIPITARIFGKEEVGMWPFQLATHPGFRGKGLFSALAEASYAESREKGYGYVTGVGNAMSTPLFVGKWGFQSVCQLDVKLGVGPVPPSRSEENGGRDVDFVRTWIKEGIAWRLHHNPVPYRVVNRGEIRHLFGATGKYGIWAEIGAFHRDLLPENLEPLRAPNPLRLWIGADKSRNWSRSLYADIPLRFRPSPLNLLFLDLTGQKRQFDPRRVRYELFDFDAY
jgi:predicted N-acetyltransferase YhbS